MITSEEIRNGEQAQYNFREYLSHHNIPFQWFDQNLETSVNQKYQMKRPDCETLDPFKITIEVKKKNFKFDNVVFDQDEVERLKQFQVYNNPIWFAISNPGVKFMTWYWVRLDSIVEINNVQIFNDKKCYIYSIKNLICTHWNEHPGKIFTNKF